LLARNTTAVQLFTVYTDPDYHNAQRYRQTGRQTDGRTDGQTHTPQTDDIMMPIADQTAWQYDQLNIITPCASKF